VDPLAGSYYVEELTHRLERLARDYMQRIEALDGPEAAVPFMAEQIHRSAYESQMRLESGDLGVVGVNLHVEHSGSAGLPMPDFAELQATQRTRLSKVKSARDGGVVRNALEEVAAVASSGDNLLPAIIEAVRVRATLGEISGRLRDLWGTYRPA